jgi:hypothetical protein
MILQLLLLKYESVCVLEARKVQHMLVQVALEHPDCVVQVYVGDTQSDEGFGHHLNFDWCGAPLCTIVDGYRPDLSGGVDA